MSNRIRISIVGLLLVIAFFFGYHFTFLKDVISSRLFHKSNNIESEFPKDFIEVKINSSYDSTLQKAMFYKPDGNNRKPLLISLHTWGGTYSQYDSLAPDAKKNGWVYIHPDYRGQQWLPNSCCFDPAIADIDDAIDFAIQHASVDTNQIYLVGKSGGGTGALAMFMKTKHHIAKYMAWAPICDYVAWYKECSIDRELRVKYYSRILDGTDSKDSVLNLEKAKEKSPFYWSTPAESSRSFCKLEILDGIYDGIQGSTSIMQSINFYNKILTDWSVTDTSCYVTTFDKANLLEHRAEYVNTKGNVGSRKIIFKKSYKNISILFFDGEHEIINDFSLINAN